MSSRYVNSLVVQCCCISIVVYIYTLHYRLLLAALHFNENSNRAQATLASGEGRYKISNPKYKKGEHTVKKIGVPPTYGMFWDILSMHWHQTAPGNSLCTLVLSQDMSMHFLKTFTRTTQCIHEVNLMLLQKCPLLWAVRVNSRAKKMRLLDTSPATSKVNTFYFTCNSVVSYKIHVAYNFIWAALGI